MLGTRVGALFSRRGRIVVLRTKATPLGTFMNSSPSTHHHPLFFGGGRKGSTRTISSGTEDYSKYFILSYDYVNGILEKRKPHRNDHLAHVKARYSRGEVVMGGALADASGAKIIFKFSNGEEGETEIKDFVESDPYVLNGLVTNWNIDEWMVVVK